ncbi:MAG: 16S rRNA (uracil(1498)-N(3))-methyltransferase [Rhodothermales bacterium]|nr:16S rRNA (uracil(1498)-N(3))-methyltransferase [Rhodothermales bacterium]
MSRKNTSRSADTAFYVHPSSISDEALILDGENFHHAVHVLRQQEGSKLTVVDGLGTRYHAVLERIDKRQAICAIESRDRSAFETASQIRLGVGLTKSKDRFEVLVEKAVELGVTELVPLRSTRVQGRGIREDRLNRIAVAAMKQSGRTRLMNIVPTQTVSGFAEGGSGWLKLVLSQHENSRAIVELLSAESEVGDCVLAIGPEGGFTPDEEEDLVARGFLRASLGEARLRTETAAIASVSIVSQFANARYFLDK